jgi:plastocyanin
MLVSSGGGWGYETVMRFQQTVTRVHVGDTVEWINFDPVEPHTVTFGCPTDAPPPCQNAGGNPFAPFSNVGPIGPGSDGAIVANMTSNIRPNTGDGISSGFLVAARQDATGQVPAGLATTKFRVTFNFPGTFRYICELHDELGMIGWVVVLPKGVDDGGDQGDN